MAIIDCVIDFNILKVILNCVVTVIMYATSNTNTIDINSINANRNPLLLTLLLKYDIIYHKTQYLKVRHIQS